jgi:hypothetical protein
MLEVSAKLPVLAFAIAGLLMDVVSLYSNYSSPINVVMTALIVLIESHMIFPGHCLPPKKSQT